MLSINNYRINKLNYKPNYKKQIKQNIIANPEGKKEYKINNLSNKMWLPFGSSFSNSQAISYADDRIDEQKEAMIEKIIDEFNNFEDVTICTGRTQLFETKYSNLFSRLNYLMYRGEEDSAKIILNRLDLIGPIGLMQDTYAHKPVEIFAKASSEEYKNEDCIKHLKYYMANKTPLGINHSTNKTDTQKKQETKETIRQFAFNKATQDTIAAYKAQLRPFVEKLASIEAGEDPFLPNCILIIGDNTKAIYDSADWLKKVTPSVNFEYIPGKFEDTDEQQSKLIETLEKAEENYQNTQKRTIIFYPNLDDLLNKERNSSENIAELKYLMQAANEDFHSTIIFYTEPDSILMLDKGTLQSNRVGLTIKE